MQIPGYTYRPELDVWIAQGFKGLDWADGSEPYLREVLQQPETISDYPVELGAFIRDWPSRYHLSHQRVNLLEAVRDLLDPSWRAIEFGAGTGIITKWLAQAVTSVDAFEGSPQRAHLNRIRTRDDHNVRVFVGDMVDAPYPNDYDLATLVGVLEYTPTRDGISRRAACLGLLNKIRASLLDDGVLLLAIENRLGNKYWTGCSEDHSSGLFDGILGYPDGGPITFSRKELESLLSEAGFVHQQFYHLHPDYKLVTTVIRETTSPDLLARHQLALSLAEDYARPRQYLMPDPLLMKSVEDAGLFRHFPNSFLVLCSPSEEAALSSQWTAKKFANSTRPELHHTVTITEVDGSLQVARAPMHKGRDHMDFPDYTFDLVDNRYVPGSLLAVEAYQALVSKNPVERLTNLCRELLEKALQDFAHEPRIEKGRFDVVEGSALDLTFWNVVRREDGSLFFFDTKWRHRSSISADYVIFRSLFHFLSAGAHFLTRGLRQTITDILQSLYPEFDEARFVEHLESERRLQECVHDRDMAQDFVDQQERWTELARRLGPPPRNTMVAAVRLLKNKGPLAFFRQVLVRLGFVHRRGRVS